jgi:succinate-acetate transporter protein
MALYTAEEGAQAVAPAVANPAPLGLSAFALTTFVLSSSNAGFIFPAVGAGGTVVVGLALFYGGLVQLVAGIQEFRAGNTFGATAFCSYGGFWLALGFILLPGTGILASLVAAKSLSAGVGTFLLGWTIFTGLMLIATFRLTGALVVVFALLFLTFLALTIGWLGGVGTGTFTTWVGIGGWLGIVTALAAWYTALAGVLASVKLAALPTLPLTPRS